MRSGPYHAFSLSGLPHQPARSRTVWRAPEGAWRAAYGTMHNETSIAQTHMLTTRHVCRKRVRKKVGRMGELNFFTVETALLAAFLMGAAFGFGACFFT